MQISKNRCIDALLKFILFSAFVHIFLIIVFFVTNLDITLLNYFNILDIDLFFPNIASGFLSQILSILVMIFIYILIFLFFTKDSSK